MHMEPSLHGEDDELPSPPASANPSQVTLTLMKSLLGVVSSLKSGHCYRAMHAAQVNAGWTANSGGVREISSDVSHVLSGSRFHAPTVLMRDAFHRRRRESTFKHIHFEADCVRGPELGASHKKKQLVVFFELNSFTCGLHRNRCRELRARPR